VERVEIAGLTLINVHPARSCLGRSCVIHRPSDHHMRGWDLGWDNDRGAFSRECPHGIEHPDPDQVAYWLAAWGPIEMGHLSFHACDGCCIPKKPIGEV
jgi:hypothetical protein